MGRTTFSGPVAGAYETFTVSMDPGTALGANILIYYIPVAFECKVVEASFMADATVLTGVPTWQIQDGGAAGAGTDAITAATAIPASDTESTIAAAAMTEANRTLEKGDILRVVLDGNNAADSVVRGTVTVTVRNLGHVVASALND